MANKWQITIDVDETEVAMLKEVLDWAASRAPKREKLDDLEAKIELAWIEREVELIPPPSEHSTHVPVYVDHSPPVYQGGCSEEIVANGYVVAP